MSVSEQLKLESVSEPVEMSEIVNEACILNLSELEENPKNPFIPLKMLDHHTLLIVHIGSAEESQDLKYLDLLPFAKKKLRFASISELAVEYPELVPFAKSKFILALIDPETSGKTLQGRVYGYQVKNNTVYEQSCDYSLASMVKWIVSDELLTNLYIEKKHQTPVLVIVTGNSLKSKLFKERVLPKLKQRLAPINEDLIVEEIELNDNGIATRSVPKDLYNWIAWFPFIGLFTNKSYKENKDLTGFAFRGVLDDYWENEYKISPDPNVPERYDENDIIHWIASTKDHVIFREVPRIPNVSL